MLKTNSKEYWDCFFGSQWEVNKGREQTRYFMRQLSNHLPDTVMTDIRLKNASILDWGCALGEGVDELKKSFGMSAVTGLDFSTVAVQKCITRYPDYSFRNQPLDVNSDKYDVIITSNCLEHFTNYLEIMGTHLPCINMYYIILVPYNERYPLCEEHLAVFSENSFPDEIPGFSKIYSKIIDTRGSNYWDGYQLLIIYKKLDDPF